MEPRQRASAEQFVILIEFMERNGDLARPQASAQGRFRADQLWTELTGLLNSVGGGVQKPKEKWKKVWADWKTKTKKKAINIRRDASGTGGGPCNPSRLSTLEERILSILGLSAVTGDDQIQEQGFYVQLEPAAAAVEDTSPPLSPTPVNGIVNPLNNESPEPGPSRRVQQDVTRSAEESLLSDELSQRVRRGRAARQRPRRRRRDLTPFDRAADAFASIEEARLRMEGEYDRRLHEREVERERMLHEREMERLRVEVQRVEMERERNNLLQRLADIPQLLNRLLQQSRDLE